MKVSSKNGELFDINSKMLKESYEKCEQGDNRKTHASGFKIYNEMRVHRQRDTHGNQWDCTRCE